VTRNLLLAGLLLARLAAADTYPRQPAIDALHYIFHLTLNDDNDDIAGDASVALRFLQDGVTSFALDLATVADGKGMAVSEVNLAGVPLQFTHATDRLTIRMASPARAGERRQFQIRYHGIPRSGLRIGLNKFGERTFYSENWPDRARQWLPMIDHPYDKATSEFIVIAPIRYQVVSNGLLLEENDLGDGRRLTHWKQSVPIASWLNAIGVGQLASRHQAPVQGIPMSTWVFHQDRDAGIATFETPARQAMEFFIDHIGPFSYEKLANVEAAGLSGGTEHASAIFYGEKSVTGKPATNLVAHEIAHQWFGDAVTEKDWDDVWLSEGFATYFTLLNTEHWEGRESFVAGLKRSRESVFSLEKKLPGAAVIHDNLSDMKKVLNQLIYQKGGWTLHMLRSAIGDDKFWTGIRTYYALYRDRNCTTDDFRAVMEETSGLELKWFFDQWLHRAGSPAVDGAWHYDPATKRLLIQLKQTQPGETYRLAVEIGVKTVAGTRVEKLDLRLKDQSFEIATDGEPTEVTLDPETRLLAQMTLAQK
jgi:aminopeptidase N